jgi:hypothetical protein
MDWHELSASALRSNLIAVALEWQARYGVSPAITSAISEYDAALLVGHSPESLAADCVARTAVTRGTDFLFNGVGYQVKACRPSGRPGSKVTWVPKPKNFEWDRLIWILYDREFRIMEAWEWSVERYRAEIEPIKRVSPADMRTGRSLLKNAE